MKSVCRRLRLPLRSTGGFTFTKIEDATAGRLIIGPRNSLTQLAWARQAERTFYGARCAAWSCPDREGETCDGASARGDTFGQRAPHDRVFRRFDGREGACLRTHGKGEGPFRFWIAYLRTIETPAPVDPLRRDPRFEKIVGSLAPKSLPLFPYSARQ